MDRAVVEVAERSPTMGTGAKAWLREARTVASERRVGVRRTMLTIFYYARRYDG
jgi:hypothetical protein